MIFPNTTVRAPDQIIMATSTTFDVVGIERPAHVSGGTWTIRPKPGDFCFLMVSNGGETMTWHVMLQQENSGEGTSSSPYVFEVLPRS
ncbi:hypothetical protein [Nannocystis punicea]|uniref:Uncharacterized protein n=1 Tax=Nannocystis punicea TaxID=2995304 RepID=A0ABY7HHR0_9BACT|nr:hypothetical protein [Nannocystis poenicansa]WAS98842.1 hypothetical protein O0S08_22150 [Nannocystis poenicansa]